MKNIKQSTTFNVSPHEVYEALMDSKKHAKFTDAKAKISRKVGGAIEAYDGWISGTNVKLVKDKLIIQKWRGDDWPEGHYSIVKFKISKAKSGAKLEFTQTEVPDQKFVDINQGWRDQYWAKMKTMFKTTGNTKSR